MAKYYVESGRVRWVLIASTARDAAAKAVQRSAHRQAEIFAEPPQERLREAEAIEWQLDERIRVNEQGFGSPEGYVFDTFDVAETPDSRPTIVRRHRRARRYRMPAVAPPRSSHLTAVSTPVGRIGDRAG